MSHFSSLFVYLPVFAWRDGQMVEKLTDKNLSLGEEVAELRSLVHHLEAVVRASEDIEDEHVAVETQLQRMRMEFVFFFFISL